MLEREVEELCSNLLQDLQSNTMPLKVASKQIVQKEDVSVMVEGRQRERGGGGEGEREGGGGEYSGRGSFLKSVN